MRARRRDRGVGRPQRPRAGLGRAKRHGQLLERDCGRILRRRIDRRQARLLRHEGGARAGRHRLLDGPLRALNATTTLVSARRGQRQRRLRRPLRGIVRRRPRTSSSTRRRRSCAADTDSNHYDVYERTGGVTSLVSTGPTTTNAQVDAFFRGASTDGTKVFFETSEALTAADTNARTDVYQRSAGTTTLVSTGPDERNRLVLRALPGSFRRRLARFLRDQRPSHVGRHRSRPPTSTTATRSGRQRRSYRSDPTAATRPFRPSSTPPPTTARRSSSTRPSGSSRPSTRTASATSTSARRAPRP